MNTRQKGFTLMEMMVSLVVGSLLITGLFKLWNTNRSQTDQITNKSGFRDKATLATTTLNRSITMAGFGMTKMNVIMRGSGVNTDTLTLYSNLAERRTTLRDTARQYDSVLVVFKDSGFTAGCNLGITDSLHQEYNKVVSITGDSSSGFRLRLSKALQNPFLPGVPDIYPVQKEIFYIEGESHALLRKVDGRTIVMAPAIIDFRVDARDGYGNVAATPNSIRVITFYLTGTYQAPQGTPNSMRFSSTVIPRNIL